MNDQSVTVRKVTVSLPDDLVAYADERAEKMNTSRSQVISLALTRIKSMEEEQLAIEGYQFYSKEAEEFAEDESIDEIADVLETLRAIYAHKGITPEETAEALCRRL